MVNLNETRTKRSSVNNAKFHAHMFWTFAFMSESTCSLHYLQSDFTDFVPSSVTHQNVTSLPSAFQKRERRGEIQLVWYVTHTMIRRRIEWTFAYKPRICHVYQSFSDIVCGANERSTVALSMCLGYPFGLSAWQSEASLACSDRVFLSHQPVLASGVAPTSRLRIGCDSIRSPEVDVTTLSETDVNQRDNWDKAGSGREVGGYVVMRTRDWMT